MRIVERERIPDTKISIGKRVFDNGTVTDVWCATYRNANGRSTIESLRTTNKATARTKALAIHQRLETGDDRPTKAHITVEELTTQYFDAAKAKGIAPTSVAKYRADIKKLTDFCTEKKLTRAAAFDEHHLYAFRAWLTEKNYAPKTVFGATVLVRQVFRFAARRGLIPKYRLDAVTIPRAKARPQPCFTTAQVEALIAKAKGEDKLAFALMAYAGLRIGEVCQLRWEDVRRHNGQLGVLHIRRGGSNGTTKDKDERFVPIHPRIAALLPTGKASGPVFTKMRDRDLLIRLKDYCYACKFEKWQQWKLHSFRHHFASLCANHNVAYRKALAWLGHSSSSMLDLYYHLHDEDSQAAMASLAGIGQAESSPNPSPAT